MRLLRPVLVVVTALARARRPPGRGRRRPDRHRGREHRPDRRARRAAPRRHVGRGPAVDAAAPPRRDAGGAGCSRPARSRSARRRRATTARSRWIRRPVPSTARTTCGATTGSWPACGCGRSSSASTRASIAEQLVRDLPYPAATVGANPAGRGLTGLASWFWVDGYSGAPIVDTVDAVRHDRDRGGDARRDRLGLRRRHRRQRTRARHAAAGAVDGHPRRSRCGPGRRYRVRALIRLAVRWRLGAGPWETLAPVRAHRGARLPGRLVPRRARPRPVTAARPGARTTGIAGVTHG